MPNPFNGKLSSLFGPSLDPDAPYLSYFDVRLTKEDVMTLKDDWLTDNMIAFWQEYLEREELSQFKQANIVLLRPSMAFMLMQTADPHSLKDALPNFKNTTHIFLPINDCREKDRAEGGSHWSLLLVSVRDGVAFHYDSLHSSNKPDAEKAARQLSILLGQDLKFVDLDDSPQQANSSDCGVFVCLEMRHLLLKKLLKAGAHDKINMSMGGKNVDAKAGRKEMLNKIEGYRREGEKRRSRSESPYRSSSKSKSPPRIGPPSKE